MVHYRIQEQDQKCRNAYGATLGQEHSEPLQELLRQRFCEQDDYLRLPTEKVIIDFDGIESTSASYLKALLVPLLNYEEPSMGDWINQPCQGVNYRHGVYPLVTGLDEEVRQELEEVLKFRNLPCLEAIHWTGDCVQQARLLGGIEPILLTTFLMLIRERAASATDLFSRYKSQCITVTGWNNRLADLYRLRLATRTKQGRQWIYEPITAEVIYG